MKVVITLKRSELVSQVILVAVAAPVVISEAAITY
jgi:hypothetical protein